MKEIAENNVSGKMNRVNQNNIDKTRDRFIKMNMIRVIVISSFKYN
jgi:hypothetical protein